MLDHHLIPLTADEQNIKHWWKKKLLSYNVIVGFFGILIIASETVLLQHPSFWWVKFLHHIFCFGILVNIGFLTGSTLELHILKYHSHLYSHTLKNTMYWTGTICSVSTMFWMEFQVLDKAGIF